MILAKNFKLLWKSKLFFLAIIIGPLLLAVLLGMAFNNADAYSITVGVYAHSYGEVENSIVDNLGENFNVLKFSDENLCIQTIKDYSSHACIVLPKSIAPETGEAGEIIFYVDTSRVNLVWMILDSLSDILERFSSEISTDLTNGLLLKLNKAGTAVLRLRDVTVQAISETNNSLGYVNQINLDIGSLDLARTQEKAEDSILKNNELETELNSFIADIDEKIAESKDILSGINSTIPELDDVEEKLDEIRGLVSDSNNTLIVSELSALLAGLEGDIFKMKETFSAMLDNTDGNKDSLTRTLGHLEQAQELIQEIDDEVNNLHVTNASKIVNPIITEIRPIANETTHFSFIYPILIVLITVFVSILLSSSIIVMEHTSKAFFRSHISSTSEVLFFTTYFLTALAIVLGSLSIFVLFANVFLDMPVNLAFFLALFLIASLFILVGSFIGYLVRSEQSSIFAGIIVSSLLVFFSNTIIPIESASGIVKGLMKYNPAVMSEVIIRKLLIYKLDFSFLLNDCSLLLAYILVLVMILFLFLTVVHGKNLFTTG